MIKLSSLVRFAKYEKKYGMHKLALLKKPIQSDVLNVGYHVIPDFWTAEQCQKARDLIDHFLDSPERENIKVWADELGADLRIMGANHLTSDLDIFSDAQINEIITSLYGVDALNGFTMAARMKAVQGNLGSGQGWHRDSCIEHQYKAILYLSDVDSNTGPFQYCPKSGNALDIVRFEGRTHIDMDQSRLDPYEHHILQQPVDELCAPAGSLVIANTRGIHRGKPIVTGQRYALTNYYWKKSIPQHIVPYLNDVQNRGMNEQAVH